MFKFFGFGKKNPVKQARPAPTSTRPGQDPGAPESRGVTLQHSDVQRELVRVVLKDTLRRHGIPAGWIACEVTGISHRNMDDELFVHLIVMQWNDALVRFAPALQSQLVLGLDRFEPGVDHSSYVISWVFSPDCQCPHTQMPDPKVWAYPAPPAAVLAPVAVSVPAPPAPSAKPKFDLPATSMDEKHSRDFAPTEPSAMR